MSEYSEKFKDPRWQKKRLEVLNRDEWTCQLCGDKKSTLHVHHKFYRQGKDPWDYSNYALVTLCEDCHDIEHSCMKDYQDTLLQTLYEKGLLATDILDFAYSVSCFTKQKLFELMESESK